MTTSKLYNFQGTNVLKYKSILFKNNTPKPVPNIELKYPKVSPELFFMPMHRQMITDTMHSRNLQLDMAFLKSSFAEIEYKIKSSTWHSATSSSIRWPSDGLTLAAVYDEFYKNSKISTLIIFVK